jgi:hypothetical protein
VSARVATSYVGWLAAFSILRYSAATEMLLGVPVWAAARGLLNPPQSGDPMPSRAWRRRAALCVGAVLDVCAAATEYPDHSRADLELIRRLRGMVSATPVPLPEGSQMVAVGRYVSFLVPFAAGHGVRFVGATPWTAAGALGWISGSPLGLARGLVYGLLLFLALSGIVILAWPAKD